MLYFSLCLEYLNELNNKFYNLKITVSEVTQSIPYLNSLFFLIYNPY
jgi:hypothetical protein